MKKVCVVGSGQLGSRHIQGLLRSNFDFMLYVLDVSVTSLALARERAAEVDHRKQIIFISSWSELPPELDVVIVATNSNVREAVVVRLLDGRSIQFLILEKVLFQRIESFHIVANLIDKKRVKTWVNHPRRMFGHYKKVGEEISRDKSPKMYYVIGGNWGLACNGLHFLDLISFFEKSDVERIETTYLDTAILESKRPGFIEFSGTLTGSFGNGAKFSITSLRGVASATTVFIGSSTNRWLIQEGGAFFSQYIGPANDFQVEMEPYVPEYQSSLTTTLIDELFEAGTCQLPSYNEASKTHIPFINALLEKYNILTGENSKVCPIT